MAERDLYLNLKGAYERLCVASMQVDDDVDRAFLQQALDAIGNVGKTNCPQWSRFDVPEKKGA